MKMYFLFLLIFVILVAACVPQSVTIPLPTLMITTTPVATTTPGSTQTLEPTFTNTPLTTTTPGPTHTPVVGFPLDSCANLKEAKISSAGVLEVIYDSRSRKFSGGDGPSELPTPPPWLHIQFSNLMLDNPFWLWSEDTQRTVSAPLPSAAVGPEISTDHRWIIFRRDYGEIKSAGYFFGIVKSELWVVDIKGQDERKLATVSINEVKARNPNIQYASLAYGWVPHTDKIYYKVELVRESSNTIDAFMLVDIHSGEALQLAQPGKAPYVVFAPDGSLAAALINEGELQLVNPDDGSVKFTLPIQIKDNFLEYSPDGKYVIGFSADGIVRVNTRDGTWQKIPLNYTTVSDTFPKFTWVDNSTILIPITNLPEGVREIKLNELLRDPDANFTIWRVNLTAAVAQPVQTFSGDTTLLKISPDGNYLTFQNKAKKSQSPNEKFVAFQKPRVKLGAGQPPNLSLVDLKTGNILRTLEAVYSIDWSPNSKFYIYGQHELVNGLNTEGYYVGAVGKEPVPLQSFGFPESAYANWLWMEQDLYWMRIVQSGLFHLV